MKIVVIGGTGLIGSKVAEKLRQRGHEAAAASPNTGVNTITGEGLAASLAGASVVVDVANSPSFEDQAVMDFFRTAGRNLIAAEIEAGIRHHVALSVVGTELMQASGYFRAKQAQEDAIKASPIPYTLVRATQFFEFVRGIAQFSTEGTVVRVPPVQFRPIAAADVADAVADAALGKPANQVIEIAGPDLFTLDEPIRRILEHDGDSRTLIADAAAPYFGIAITGGTLVPAKAAQLGTTRFDRWLANTPSPAASH